MTFEGPDVYSVSTPLRGTVLAGKMRELCNEVVNHISEVTGSNRRSGVGVKKIARMVLNFKVDRNDKIWVLFSSSIRLVDSMARAGPSSPWRGIHEHAGEGAPLPLNIDSVVKLPPTIKLSQTANHDPSVTVQNDFSFLSCPSCNSTAEGENFHPVPYKTIITHFEKVISILTKKNGTQKTVQWPPDPLIIKAAGGVGFGAITKITSTSNLDPEDVVIPPVIRHIHGRLKVEGYQRYRQLASTYFQIMEPIRLDITNRRRFMRDSCNNDRDNFSENGAASKWIPLKENG
eukprot:14785885-Ditylum_brightwellii.AAC.1